MAVQVVVKDETKEYPVVNLAFTKILNDEVQIHQGPAFSTEVPTLENFSMKRDVVSMGRDQAINMANQIIEHYNSKGRK